MAENTFSLIDLKTLSESEPARKLIETVGDAVGMCHQPTHIRRKAPAEADADVILAKSQTQVHDIEIRASERLRNRELRRQNNIESITAKALEALPSPEAVSKDPVDGDWVSMFFEQCQDVSNKQMQSFWAKLLAGEVAVPGSYSLRTLALVKVISQRDADLFTRFCSLLWSESGTGALVPFISGDWEDRLQQKRMSFPYLLHLQSLGVIELAPGFGFTRTVATGTVEVSYFGRNHSITLASGNNQFRLGNALLTEIGHQLAPIAGAEPDEEYRECVVKWWRASNYQVIEHAIGGGKGSSDPSNVVPPVPAHQAQEAEIVVGAPEWDDLTERRAALIDKMYSPGQGLTDEEQAEYEQLQKRSRAAIEQAYPRPKLAPDELVAVKQALGINNDADGQ